MMTAQRKNFLLTIMCGFFVHISSAASPAFSNLIVFGDSISDAASLSTETPLVKERDVGNNFWVVTEGKTGAPITSEDSTTNLHILWPNYLMSSPGLIGANPNQTHYIYPQRQAQKMGYSPLRYSINYAWASAETGSDYVNDLLLAKSGIAYLYNNQHCASFGAGLIGQDDACVPGVLLQVQSYLKDVDNHPNPHSLVIIWAGGNDIFNNISKIAAENKDTNKVLLLLKMLQSAYPVANTTLSNPVIHIKSAVEMLISAGVPAKNIYVIGMPDLAMTPAAQAAAKGQKMVLFIFSSISRLFNTALRVHLAFNYWHAQYNLPNGNIISSQTVIDNIRQHPESYNMDQLTQGCVADHAQPFCLGYVFFNQKHPSTQTHQYVADYIARIIATHKNVSLGQK